MFSFGPSLRLPFHLDTILIPFACISMGDGIFVLADVPSVQCATTDETFVTMFGAGQVVFVKAQLGKACMIYPIYPLNHLYVLRLESDWTHRRLWTFLNSHSPRLMFWRPCYTRSKPAKICQVFIWVVKLQTYFIFTPWGRRAHIFQMGLVQPPTSHIFIQAVARWWSSRLVSVGWSTAFGVAPRLARQKNGPISEVITPVTHFVKPFIGHSELVP